MESIWLLYAWQILLEYTIYINHLQFFVSALTFLNFTGSCLHLSKDIYVPHVNDVMYSTLNFPGKNLSTSTPKKFSPYNDNTTSFIIEIAT